MNPYFYKSLNALNRSTSMTRPDSSEILPTYNEAIMLESVDVKIRGAGTATTFISDINYNEKGQRTKIVYGNNAHSMTPLKSKLASL